MTNVWKHLLNKTHVKVSEKCLKQWLSTFQEYWIISRNLARRRNSINGFHMNSGKVKELDVMECGRCCFCRTLLIHFLIEEWSTCYEKWFLYDNSKRSAQWLDLSVVFKHLLKSKLFERNIMNTVWSAAIGVVHYNFLESNQNITVGGYCQHEIDVWLSKIQPALTNRRGPIFASWQCPATCYQDGPTEAHQFEVWNISTTNTFSWSLAYRQPIFQSSGQFLRKRSSF